MPVVTFGVMPSSTTLRTSTPSGVPRQPSAGSLNRLLRPAQMRSSWVVMARASLIDPPTKAATDGEPAAAAPPRPTSSRTALSPTSRALVSGPWPA